MLLSKAGRQVLCFHIDFIVLSLAFRLSLSYFNTLNLTFPGTYKKPYIALIDGITMGGVSHTFLSMARWTSESWAVDEIFVSKTFLPWPVGVSGGQSSTAACGKVASGWRKYVVTKQSCCLWFFPPGVRYHWNLNGCLCSTVTVMIVRSDRAAPTPCNIFNFPNLLVRHGVWCLDEPVLFSSRSPLRCDLDCDFTPEVGPRSPWSASMRWVITHRVSDVRQRPSGADMCEDLTRPFVQ